MKKSKDEKILETREEKKARRLAKKQLKEKLRSQENEHIQSHGYSDDINPFGDSNLSKAFKWSKKVELEKEEGSYDPKKYSKMSEISMRKAMAREIEEVKRRREEREAEQALWDQEKARMQADADGLTLEEWEERGNKFELDQIEMRTNNRFKEQRAKPIDVLFKSLRVLAGGEGLDLLGGSLREPGKVIAGLSIGDLKELLSEIEELERYDTRYKRHWSAMLTVCQDELTRQQKAGEKTGVHSNVYGDVVKTFESKTLDELCKTEQDIRQQIKAGGVGVDMEFWTTLLKQLDVWKAKSFLKEDFQKRINELVDADEGDSPAPTRKRGADSPVPHQGVTTLAESDDEDDLEHLKLSPPVKPMKNAQSLSMIDERIDMSNLFSKRFAGGWQRTGDTSTGTLTMKEQEDLMYSRGEKLDEEEELFDDQVRLKQLYSWHDKYRPRKPKYFNRVHTGFDWNKYNSTHFDVDNPPPKIVMGYKFNIFYPDLVDPTQQPTFFVEPTEKGWRDDVCILRFSAGPPYEDIAFKIVNREWDRSGFRGYKCVFERGVLHLYFSFVKYRYRR